MATYGDDCNVDIDDVVCRFAVRHCAVIVDVERRHRPPLCEEFKTGSPTRKAVHP